MLFRSGTIPLATLATSLCFDSAADYATNPYCAQIRRDATGTNGAGVKGGILDVTLTNQNVARVKVEGFDFSLAYAFDLAAISGGKDWGRLALKLDGTMVNVGAPGEPISLGIFNLFPFPALDGGRIIFLLPELIFRRRVPPRLENLIHGLGMTVLLLFMIYVNVMDFVNPINVTVP